VASRLRTSSAAIARLHSIRRRTVTSMTTSTPTNPATIAPRDPEATIEASRSRNTTAAPTLLLEVPAVATAQAASGSDTAKSIAIVFGFWPMPVKRAPCPVVAGTMASSGEFQSSRRPPTATAAAAARIASSRGSTSAPREAATPTPRPAANSTPRLSRRPRLSAASEDQRTEAPAKTRNAAAGSARRTQRSWPRPATAA
jgi:hypothetical protein